jgi:CRISPR-associated protein Csm3
MNMFAKLKIAGNIEVMTGLHIGGSSAFSAIGAVDSPVVRDPGTRLPVIPGSSLKGKMRTLLARARSDSIILPECKKDTPELLRLFGGSEQDPKTHRLPVSRLKFSDCFMTNAEDLARREVSVTEIKFENTINRLTAVANPRQIERVVRGAVFGLEIIYDVDDPGEAAEDFRIIREGFALIQYDYLGGHGSRGSGRVRFVNLKLARAFGEIDPSVLTECETILQSLSEEAVYA